MRSIKQDSLKKNKQLASTLLFGLLLSVFVVSPLPLGSNRVWASLALSGFSFAILSAYLIANAIRPVNPSNRSNKGLGIDVGVVLIFLVAVWLSIQALIKVPLDWMSVISPIAAKYYASAFSILRAEKIPDAVTLSLERGVTLNSALLTLAVFSVLYLMGQLIATPKQLRFFCYTIVLSGCFQALYGVMMTLTGVEHLLLIPKTKYIGNATGTFVNRNSLAGYLEMTLAVGVGLLLGLRKTQKVKSSHWNWRRVTRKVLETMLSEIIVVRFMLVIMVVGLIMTHSRMGNAAFFNALLITSAAALLASGGTRASGQYRNSGFLVILASIIAIDIFLLGSVFQLDKVVERLEKTAMIHENRVDVTRYAMAMIPDFWLTGSGAGTFLYLFPNYAKEDFGMFFDFAHNDYLQIFLEFGLIGSIPLALYTAWALVQGSVLMVRGHTGLARGMGFAATMACISLLIHSTVDFNLQIPANLLLFAAVLRLPAIASKIDKQANRA